MRFIPVKKVKYRSLRMPDDVRFKCFADYSLPGGLFLDRSKQRRALEDLLPFFQQRRGVFGEDFRRGRELGEMDAGLTASTAGR
jgi:hypothetical protein